MKTSLLCLFCLSSLTYVPDAGAWTAMKLNDIAVTNSSGSIVVLGTEGSWSNKGDTKEHVFDGNTSTYFDPPNTAAGNAWAGIQLRVPSCVMRIRYYGRDASTAARMIGCQFQGANSEDFSDAVTIHTAAPPSGWSGTTWVDVSITPTAHYTYLRIISTAKTGSNNIYCGNAAEVEFYGCTNELSAPITIPVPRNLFEINHTVSFRWTADTNTPVMYQAVRVTTADDDAFVTNVFATAGGQTIRFIDKGVPTGEATYTLKAVNALGEVSTNLAFTVRNEATGGWIGSTGSWNNAGAVGSNLFDGNPETYYDAMASSGEWSGLDLGKDCVIVGARFIPRPSFAGRMFGGWFEGADDTNFTDAVTLYTITNMVTPGVITEVHFTGGTHVFRYVRYVSPVSGYCNANEIAFLLPESDIEGPECPVFSAEPGFYSNAVTLAIAYDLNGADIYYTLDGSTPTCKAGSRCFKYTGPLTLSDCSSRTNRLCLIPTNPPEMTNSTMYGYVTPAADQPNVNVIRARAFFNGLGSTNEAVGTWLIGPVPNAHTLRVFSLLTDEENLFNDSIGLMVPGDIYKANGFGSNTVGKPNANYFQSGSDWERPAYLQMFDTNRVSAINQKVGVRMHGSWSRAAAQKTMCFYARDEYGKKKFKTRLFPDQDYDTFKRFLLRNSGNDWASTGFGDAIAQKIFLPYTTTGMQNYMPSVVYIDGEYWGILNIRDHYSKFYFERVYGANPDNVDYVKRDAADGMMAEEGDMAAFEELKSYITTNDLSLSAPYQHVCEHIDIDNMIDSFICNIFACNTDWVNNGSNGNNQGLWRERVAYTNGVPSPHDGRWRWLVYDMDHGFNLSSTPTTEMYSAAKADVFFNALIQNPSYRNRFINRLSDLLNTCFLPERTTAIITNAQAAVAPEIPRHIARWSRMISSQNWSNNVANHTLAFAKARPAALTSQMQGWFSLPAPRSLTLSTNGSGRVSLNTLTSGDGPTALRLPWTGKYFPGVPVTLSPKPSAGWAFDRWECSDGRAIDASPLVLSLTNDLSVTAVFTPSGLPRIAINEIMADADTPDWFELLNLGTDTADLSGCWLTDDTPSHACEIPDGTTLAPGAFLLVWANGLTGANPDGSLNVSFGLGKKGDSVVLLTQDKTVQLARVDFGKQTTNVSTGSFPDGDTNSAASFTLPTPAAPNRDPALTAALLPPGLSTNVPAGGTLTLPFAVTNGAPGTYSLSASSATSYAPQAAIDPSTGLFTWTVPSSATNALVPFTISWTDGTLSDRATLLVAVLSVHTITVSCAPAEGGSVSGGGRFPSGSRATISAAATNNWRFVSWNDGLTDPLRTVTVRQDAAYSATFAFELPPVSPIGATVWQGAPLVYWPANPDADTYAIYRSSTQDGTYSLVASTAATCWLDATAASGSSPYYKVTARHGPYESDILFTDPAQAWPSATTRKLTGPVIGTLGSWNSRGDVREHAFDGDTSTTFDNDATSQPWTGIDLLTPRDRTFTLLRFWPRDGMASRMAGGAFQLSLSSDGTSTFDSPATLYTVPAAPAQQAWASAALATNAPCRFFRYLSPSGGFGNVNEIELYGYDTVPAAPALLSADKSAPNRISLSWQDGDPSQGIAAGYLVWTNGVPAAFTPDTSATLGGLPDGTTFTLRVSAVNGNGHSPLSSPLAVSTLAPRQNLLFLR
jgi:hypothetical protein